MENFSFHVPFYIVTNGVATQGYTSDLAGGQIGLFDRQTWAVSTASGSGKELFFAQGSVGGKGYYGEPVTESHKSPFFMVKDVTNIYKSLPHTIQNEEWILGFDGSASSKSLEYIKGEPTRIKLYFHGEPVYRMFNGPKEYVISWTPPADCTTDCATECGGERQDPLPNVIKHIDLINKDVELRKLGVKAQLVSNTYTAATATKEKYSLTVMDDGSNLALAKIQQLVGNTKKVTRISRSGIISVYKFSQPIPDGAPVNYVYDTQGIKTAVCGVCPAGWTSVAATDTYFIYRQIASTDDFTTDTSRDTFADTVGTAYGVAVDADKTFVGTNGSQAIVQVVFAGGTVVNAINSDTISLISSKEAYCVAPAGLSVAWTLGNTCVSGSRVLKIKLKRPDCNAAGNRSADVTAALTGVEGVDISTLTVIAGTACIDEYTVKQNSNDCLDENCLTSNVSFNYGADLPMIDGQAWELTVPTYTVDNTRKVGIRISAGYYSPKFGNCSFDPYDYYENMPLKMEVSLLKENNSACIYGGLATQFKVKNARIARQSGEWVVREHIMKTEAYLQHVKQWDNSPRMREAFDQELLTSVDRDQYYTLWYVSYGASYNATSRTGIKERFTTVFAIKESDASIANLETNIIDVVASKSGVVPHVNA